MLIPKTANCGTLGDWAKQNGKFIPYTGNPQTGDLVLMDFSGKHKTRQHVGILVSRTGDTLTTIEGNTSVTSNDNGGAVMRRTRYVSQVVGYVRPKWTNTQTAARLIQIAAGQVGVTEYPSGSNKVKYNTWYYGKTVSGSAYPWCAVFVCWCFAVLAGNIQIEGGNTVTVSAYLLASGSKGSAVKKLQILLNGLGYSVGTVDGEFGAKTKAAVIKYQKDNGLTADGEVGKDTWSKLIN